MTISPLEFFALWFIFSIPAGIIIGNMIAIGSSEEENF